MNYLQFLSAVAAILFASLIGPQASAQCGQQRVIDPTNAFLGSGGVGVSVQGGGACQSCQQGASVSTSASVSALQSQIRALNARIAGMQRSDVRVYAAPARIASYQAYDVGGGGGASASSAAGSASSSASASAPRSTRALYVVPSAVYAMDDGGAAASASSSASASGAVDVAPSIALVPLNATDVQVAAGGGCGGGGRIRGLFRGRSRSRSVSVSVARN